MSRYLWWIRESTVTTRHLVTLRPAPTNQLKRKQKWNILISNLIELDWNHLIMEREEEKIRGELEKKKPTTGKRKQFSIQERTATKKKKEESEGFGQLGPRIVLFNFKGQKGRREAFVASFRFLVTTVSFFLISSLILLFVICSALFGHRVTCHVCPWQWWIWTLWLQNTWVVSAVNDRNSK